MLNPELGAKLLERLKEIYKSLPEILRPSKQ